MICVRFFLLFILILKNDQLSKLRAYEANLEVYVIQFISSQVFVGTLYMDTLQSKTYFINHIKLFILIPNSKETISPCTFKYYHWDFNKIWLWFVNFGPYQLISLPLLDIITTLITLLYSMCQLHTRNYKSIEIQIKNGKRCH